MKKTLSILAVLALILTLFSACGNGSDTTTAPTQADTTNADTTAESTTAATDETQTSAAKAEVKLGMLAGPSGLGAAFLISENDAGRTINSYTCSIESDPTVFTAALLNGDIDIAALPTNVAATLYAKSHGKVQLLAVSTLGVIYILDRSGEVSSIADLAGKTVLSAGQGTTTEYVLKYLIEANGMTMGEAGSNSDVTVEYAANHAQVVTMTQTQDSEYDVVLLPEPFVSKLKSADSAFNTAIDLTDEWKKLGNGELTMGCVAVRSEFAENNAQAVKDFLEDYELSINYVNANTAQAALFAGQYEILESGIAQAAIPNCNITFLAGEAMKAPVTSFLQVLFDSAAAAVGGAMPDDGFWFIANS